MEEEKKQAGYLDNFEPNVIAAFSYLFPFITGVAFYLIEKENKFIRFHAVQSVLFWLAVFIASALVETFYGIWYFMGVMASSALRIVAILLWLFLMWKAYKNEEYQLPYLGKIAKDQAGK